MPINLVPKKSIIGYNAKENRIVLITCKGTIEKGIFIVESDDFNRSLPYNSSLCLLEYMMAFNRMHAVVGTLG